MLHNGYVYGLIFNGFEKRNIMDLENKVRQQLLSRGFTKEQLLNNRGLIGAAIDETALNVVKNLAIHDVSGSSLPLKIERVIVVAAQRWGNDYAGSTVGIIGRDALEICEQYGIDWNNYR